MKTIRNAVLILLLFAAPAAALQAGLFSPGYKFIPIQGKELDTWQPGDLGEHCELQIRDGGYSCKEVAAGGLRLIFVAHPVSAAPETPRGSLRERLEVAVVQEGATPAERSTAPRQIVSGPVTLLPSEWIPYAVAVDGRSLYLVYADERQLWLVSGRLPAGSATRIDFDPHPLKIMDCSRCAQELRLAASRTRLHLLRTTGDWRGSSDILHYASAAKSDLARGKSRWEEKTMSRSATNFGMALLAENDEVYALWSDRRFGHTRWDSETNVGKIFIARSVNEGGDFSEPFGVVNKPDDYRDIAREHLTASLDDPGAIFVFWSNGFDYPGAGRPGYYGAIVARDLSYQKRP